MVAFFFLLQGVIVRLITTEQFGQSLYTVTLWCDNPVVHVRFNMAVKIENIYEINAAVSTICPLELQMNIQIYNLYPILSNALHSNTNIISLKVAITSNFSI